MVYAWSIAYKPPLWEDLTLHTTRDGINVIGATMKGSDGKDFPQPEHDKEYILVEKFESHPGDLITIRVFLETNRHDVKVIEMKDDKFTIRKVDDTNTKNKEHLKKIRIFFNTMTILLFVSSVALFIIPFTLLKINFWILLALSVITFSNLCFIVSRLFNFIILSRQPK